MTKSPFVSDSYKDYLRSLVRAPDSRGLLSQLAEAAECQRPYLSKVLQVDSETHLTPDHMYGICEFLKLLETEKEYLKLLLEKARASNSGYRRSLEVRLKRLKDQYLDLKEQTGKESLSLQESTTNFYYTHWLYGALHIAVSIPELQTVAALAKRFAVPAGMVDIFLARLEAIGLVKFSKGRWEWYSGDLHLESTSPMNMSHHLNWRMQAVQNSAQNLTESRHYSVVQSLSKEDYERLRIQVTEWVKRFEEIASPSASEELVCFNLDFFRVGFP